MTDDKDEARAAFERDLAEFIDRAAREHRIDVVIVGGVDLRDQSSFVASGLDDRGDLEALTELTEITAERVFRRKLRVRLVQFVDPSRGEPIQ